MPRSLAPRPLLALLLLSAPRARCTSSLRSAAISPATPNVWEHHARALYINVPVSDATASRLALEWSSSLQPARYDGRCWLSVVVDDLDKLLKYSFGGSVRLPTGMQSWMTKVNQLVEGHGIADQPLPGYQILSIYFERGVSGGIMALGARTTQQVPAATARYEMSSGRSGRSMASSMAAGSAYAASMRTASSDAAALVELKGALASPSAEDVAFARFVVERPHKFLAQKGGQRVAYSPELGPGASFSAEGVMAVRLDATVQLPILQSLLEPAELEALDLNAAVCFLQPEYTLVDHKNEVLETEPQAGL